MPRPGRPKFVIDLARAAAAAPSADNSQPWQIRYCEPELSISYANRVTGKTFAADHHATLLAIGAATENIHAAANAMGVSLERLTPADGGYVKFRVDGSRALPLVDTHPLFSRHTNRFAYKRALPPATPLDEISALREGEAEVRVITDAGEIKALARATDLSSQVRFQTREVHELLAHSLRFEYGDVARGDGLDVSSFDLPPGGRFLLSATREWKTMAFLNRFGIYRVFAAAESKPVAKAPAVIAVVGGDALDAGRLMQRCWMMLNAAGLALQPHYVVADQLLRRHLETMPAAHKQTLAPVAELAAKLFGPAQLHIMLRCGYATRNAPRARRLPLNDVFEVQPC